MGAFLVGLTLTGDTATRARKVLGPLRDLFAAIFFVAIGLSVDPHELLPVLPVALILAVVTAVTKVAPEYSPPGATQWHVAGSCVPGWR